MANNYNPDVLNCIANLSNDEVFTPPTLANQVLDMFPQELFQSPKTTFLDPFTKSGVFLREIVKRLDRGLESQIPDRQARIDHIMHNQVFGIACTELTAHLSRRSLYCSKHPDGEHSVSHFDSPEGNVKYTALSHTWENGKCIYCGASQSEYDRDSEAEQYAYMFLHTESPRSIFDNMNFDVIIGNPPYQLSDGGNGTSAKPIYNLFVSQAIKLKPRYLSMIIPARWYAGGKGLDDFREDMLTDNRLRKIVDYPDAGAIFPGVQIKGGVCYFLWDRDNMGQCTVVSNVNGKTSTMTRNLIEGDEPIFIRFNEAISILNKVRSFNEPSIKSKISARKPFGFPTTFAGSTNKTDGSIRIYQNGGFGYVKESEVHINKQLINKYKVFIPPLGSGSDSFPHPILGKPFVGEPGSVCSETYIIAGIFDSEKEAKNLISYISTKLFRFLVLLHKPSQHATSKVYAFVPDIDLSAPITDTFLYEKYGITKDEQEFIDSLIRPLE